MMTVNCRDVWFLRYDGRPKSPPPGMEGRKIYLQLISLRVKQLLAMVVGVVID